MLNTVNDYIDHIKNKRVLIWGLGLQGGGLSSALFFAQNGAEVRVTDLKNEATLTASLVKLHDYPVQYTLGRHEQKDFEWADIVIINQDVFHRSPDSPYLQFIYDSGKEFETEMGLFFKLCSTQIIGITGSRGKTTTTIALASVLKDAGKKVFVGGNIPQSFNLANIEEANTCEVAVLELSNYQLHGLDYVKRSPYIAVITSISPDHMISYASFEQYIKDKEIIYKHQTISDHLVLKQGGEHTDYFAANAKSHVTYFNENTLPEDWVLKVPGRHNRENLGAVFQVARLLGIPEETVKHSLTSFVGVAYRLEKVAEINGISFINDTTATTPTAAEIALKSFQPKKVLWIGGGTTKKLPLNTLVSTIHTHVNKMYLLEGSGTEELLNALGPQYSSPVFGGVYKDLKSAVQQAFTEAEKGDVILLSPGFTSFGMFENEFDRGDKFNNEVEQIKLHKVLM